MKDYVLGKTLSREAYLELAAQSEAAAKRYPEEQRGHLAQAAMWRRLAAARIASHPNIPGVNFRTEAARRQLVAPRSRRRGRQGTS
jgi:hypothetical protein